MSPVPGLRFRGTARFGGEVLFGPLEIECRAAEWTCLLGPSGVGKSTILRLIAGIAKETAFEGAITMTDGAEPAVSTAYMAQEDLLFPWLDVPGNVLVGASLRGEAPDRDRAMALIERVGLAGHAAKRPKQLSGGMRQRVALARLLMEDRPVVLLDEPFSALDARTRAEMQELAAELLAGRTVLLVTHDPAEAARLGHRIALLSPAGFDWVVPPDSPPIRAYDDAEVFACQTRLMRAVRAGGTVEGSIEGSVGA